MVLPLGPGRLGGLGLSGCLSGYGKRGKQIDRKQWEESGEKEKKLRKVQKQGRVRVLAGGPEGPGGAEPVTGLTPEPGGEGPGAGGLVLGAEAEPP